MKRFAVTLALLGAALQPVPTAVAAQPPAAEATAERPVLQVHVTVPPTGDLSFEDDVAEVFVDALHERFRQRGFAGRIEQLRRVDDARDDQPLLNVRIIRWQRQRSGGIDCRVHATLRPSEGEPTSLGSYSATELGLMVNSSFDLAEAFRDAAEQVAGDIWRDLARRQLLPELVAQPGK